MGNYIRKSGALQPPTPASTDGSTQATARGHHKGLINLTGENNCFLNVTIQALWHLDSFRDAVATAEATTDIVEVSINDMITIVNSLFAFYEYSEGSAVPVTELRKQLTSMDPKKYSLGSLADATEALYSILSKIHWDSCGHSAEPASGIISENCECNPKCLAHTIFGGVFVEQYACSACGATSEPQIMNRLLHYVYTDEIVNIVSTTPTRPHFSSVLSYCLRPVPHACPSHLPSQHCQGEGTASLSCLEPPQVLAFCVSWAEAATSRDKLESFVRTIETVLSVSDVFPFGEVADRRFNGCFTHSLCGVICFYGKHYICFFRDDSSSPVFILFDDSRMRVVGTWDDVQTECIRSRYQPVLLLYQLDRSYHAVPPDSPQMSVINSEIELSHAVPVPGQKNRDEAEIPWVSERSRSGSIRLSHSSLSRLNKIYNVVLYFEDSGGGRKTLGLHVISNNGKLIVDDFVRHANGSLLCAERSGKISLLDKLVLVNGIPVDGWSPSDLFKYLQSLTEFPCVTIRFESKWEE